MDSQYGSTLRMDFHTEHYVPMQLAVSCLDLSVYIYFTVVIRNGDFLSVQDFSVHLPLSLRFQSKLFNLLCVLNGTLPFSTFSPKSYPVSFSV